MTDAAHPTYSQVSPCMAKPSIPSVSQSAPVSAPQDSQSRTNKAAAANAARVSFPPEMVAAVQERLEAAGCKRSINKAPAADAGGMPSEREIRRAAMSMDLNDPNQAAIACALREIAADRAPATSAAALPDEWAQVLDEVARATRKFPTWPTDPLHAIAVLGEEFGELTKAVLQTTYEPHKVEDGELRTEAIQTAAMALRFVASLGTYQFTRCAQHSQDRAAANGAAGQEGGAA